MLAENKKKFKDDQTDKRIHEHLTNREDLISDEDIKNVKTNVEEEQPGNNYNSGEDESGDKENLPGKPGKESPDKISGRTDDPGIQTPWNIL